MATPFAQNSGEETKQILESMGYGVGKRALGLASNLLWGLSRPYHSVVGGLDAMAKEGSILEGLKGAAQGLIGTGKDKYAGDLLQTLGMDRGEEQFRIPVLDIPVHTRDFAALPLTFALDPLMYSKIGGLTAKGFQAKKDLSIQPTFLKQLLEKERVGFQFMGSEVPILSPLVEKALIPLAGAGRAVRTSRIVENIFGPALDANAKALFRKARAMQSGIVTDISPQVEFLDDALKQVANSHGKDYNYVAGLFRKYAEMPTKEKLTSYGDYLRQEIHALGTPSEANMETFKSLTKDLGMVTDKLTNKQYFTIDKLKTYLQNDQTFLETINTFRDLNNQLLKVEQYKNIPITDLRSAFEYFPRVSTPELREAIYASSDSAAKRFFMFDEALANAMKRHNLLRNVTIDKANQIMKKEYGLKGDAFVLDPAMAMYARVQNHAKSVSTVDFIKEAYDKFGRMGKAGAPLPDEFLHLGERWTNLGNPAFKRVFDSLQQSGQLPPVMAKAGIGDIVFPEKIAKALDESLEIYTDSFSSFKEILDAFNKRWKPMVTSLFPAFHFRNWVDDSIRMHLGGMKITDKKAVESFKDAAEIYAMSSKIGGKNLPAYALNKSDEILARLGNQPGDVGAKFIHGTLEGVLDKAGSPITRQAAYKEMMDNGIIGSGFWDSELWSKYEQIMKDPSLTQKAVKWLESKGQVARIGSKAIVWFDPVTNPVIAGAKRVSSTMEDVRRMAFYLHKRKNGFTPEAAANDTMNFLYDYTDIGKGEQIIKSMMPFWSFTRNNIPFWLSRVGQNPGFFSGLEKVSSAFPGSQEESEYLPDILREGIPIKIAPGKSGKSTYLYSFGLSAEDLNKFVASSPFRSVEKFVLSSLSPVIKYPLEMATDKNFFFNTSIPEYDKAYKVLKLAPKSIQDWMGLKERQTKEGVTYYRADPYVIEAIQNSPIARFYSTAGKLMDEERSWGAKIQDEVFGFKTKVVDTEREKQRAIKGAVKSFLKETGRAGGEIKAFDIMYIPDELKESVPPEIQKLVKEYSRVEKKVR